jgi:DNA polymerase elongation subunit (family B)
MSKLINGKSDLQGIVGIEVSDTGEAEIFQQLPSGEIVSKFVPHRYWLLTNENVSNKLTRMHGNLHYKWGFQETDRNKFVKIRANLMNSGVDVYNIYNAEEALMVKDGYTYFKGMKPTDISLVSFDIETTGLDPNAEDAFVVCISAAYRSIHGTEKAFFSYDEYEDQKEMIDAFCSFVRETNPSLIIGHNIIPYDLMYLNAIAKRVGTELALGRDGSEIHFNRNESKFRVDGTREIHYKNCSIYGREIVDTLFLAYKFDVSKSIETYALKPMIKQLGFEKADRAYYDASKIRENFRDAKELELIKSYCRDDSDDPIKLWDHMGPLYFHLAPIIPKPFSELVLGASGSQINALMLRAYLQDGHSIPKASEIGKFEGALSWGKPGIYRNVFKADCVAMYPSIILKYSVFDEYKDPNGYLLELTREFRRRRLEYKKLASETGEQYWKEMDTTAKSILNSFYGFFGATGLNFNSYDCAEFITRMGREILQTSIVWATGKQFQDIAPDYYETDDAEEEEE